LKIFNDEVDAYQSWTLFLICVSILVLICGVVLLTHKKPESTTGKIKSSARLPKRKTKTSGSKTKLAEAVGEEEEQEGETQVLWALGEPSDDDAEGGDDDVDHRQPSPHQRGQLESRSRTAKQTDEDNRRSGEGADFVGLARRSTSQSRSRAGTSAIDVGRQI